MRRSIAPVAAMLLTLALSAPAAAVPVNSPHIGQWEISCEQTGPFTVNAIGVPGWPTDWEPGMTNIHFVAGEFRVVVEGIVVAGPFVETAPPGLLKSEKLVGPCFMHLADGSPAFDVTVEDAWYFYPTSK